MDTHYKGYMMLTHTLEVSQTYHTFLAIYDTTVSPQTCTGSENIDITNNEISLDFPLKINDEIVLTQG